MAHNRSNFRGAANNSCGPPSFSTLRRKLLCWFDRNRRDLPWRVNRDPYRIWISEVMLQQTTVAAVVPYFNQFLAAFPDVKSLAAADEQQVLKLWEGLGYYRRARHLHAAARILVTEHDGSLPDDPMVWAALPGIGRYILGAVLSQAFDHRLPIVEVNSLRVLARLFGYRGDPREGEGKAWTWSAAESLLPAKRPGDFNQALMELGALVCTPTSPRCGECPLAKYCAANRDGLQAVIPPPKRQKERVAIEEVAVVLHRRGRILLCRRPPDASRWQNMWEVPHAEVRGGETPPRAAVRIAPELTGFDVAPGNEIATIRHGVTRFAITMICMEATIRGGSFASDFYSEGRWVKPDELTHFPVSTPQRRLMAELVSSPS
jgi:A/G-specific adenine glycosylase